MLRMIICGDSFKSVLRIKMPETKKILRHMAWERAKGELWAMLQTYYSTRNGEDEKYEEMLEAFRAFRDTVEQQCLHE